MLELKPSMDARLALPAEHVLKNSRASDAEGNGSEAGVHSWPKDERSEV